MPKSTTTLDKIADILELEDGSRELAWQSNERAELYRMALIRKVMQEHEQIFREQPWRGQIKSRRLELNMSRAELAQKVGVSHSFIGFLENGQRTTVEPVASRIREVLNL